ncbi:S8 family serine peptidase [Dyadobacter sp. 32]|uniref:S8 family serine peptidase n=1 Tax=Dyadobacter sp. 32 TaxID=538966 RepID=UPI0011ED3EFE
MRYFYSYISIHLLLLLLGIPGAGAQLIGEFPEDTEKASDRSVAPIAGQYIVVYKKNGQASLRSQAGTSLSIRKQRMSEEVAATLQKNNLPRRRVLQVYETALQGFAISGLTTAEADRLRKDNQVAYVVPDKPVYLADHGALRPAALAGSCNGRSIMLNGVFNYTAGAALYGGAGPVTGEVVLVNDGTAEPTLGCGIIPAMTGKIALMDLGGTCSPADKALKAQEAGAVGVIIANNVAGGLPAFGDAADPNLVTIPVMSLNLTDANALKTMLVSITVNATLDPARINNLAQCIPWGVTRVGGGLSGAGKRAWIIDTGIDLTHPDLNVNTALSAFFVGTSANDGNGHGSHVAGTVAAIDNGIGVLGVAAGAEVIPVRVFPDRGSTPNSVVIAGVNYVAAHAIATDVVNMSLGGSPDPAQEEAVLALSQICKVVIAAGNDAADANYKSPARVNGPNIYTVSAMDINDKLASFSSFGNAPIDYAAPGVNVGSCTINGGYAYSNGTSMAAPHVTGLLLLGAICSTSKVTGDKDGNPDPIATRYIAANDTDQDGDGVTVCQGDLDDNNPNIKPGATEICDGLDNDCDGLIDEGNVCCPAGNTGILYVNVGATGIQNGLTWADAFTSLQAALDVAHLCTQITQIRVAKGSYYPEKDRFGQTAPSNARVKSFIMRNNLAIYGGFFGNEGAGYDLSQRDMISNKTILNGNIQQDGDPLNNAYHVILNVPTFGIALDASAVLDGFTVTGGMANVTGANNSLVFPNSFGGGMFNYDSSPIIRNCSFESNEAKAGGGLDNMFASPTITHATFLKNVAKYGGGIHNDVSSPVITNSYFQLNSAEYGGGMSSYDFSDPAVTNTTFSGNNALNGGSLFNSNASSPVIKNSIFWGNGSEIANQAAQPASETQLEITESIPVVSYSIIEGGWTGAGANNLNADPRFVSQPVVGQASPGDLTLLPCSPAINAGDPATTSTTAGSTDLASNSRFFGSRIDIGAYEFQSAPFEVLIAANPGLTVTSGSSTTLTASGALGYLWSTAATTAAITVAPTVATTYTVTGTSGACSQIVSVMVTTGPLPVTLISFLAKKETNGSVKLTWLTANEADNAYFELERSTDLKKIDILAKVAADENPAATHSYQYTDELPLAGTSYYRLKQVDLDGHTTKYSWVSIAGDRDYVVFPNPVQEQRLQLQLDEPESAAVKLYSVEGRSVPLETVSRSAGVVELKLPQNATKGVYLLRVEERGQSRAYRVVVE